MSTPEKVTAAFYDHASLWTGTDCDAGHTTDGGRVFGITRRRYAECDRYKCPPVVVIDPEDQEQVEALDAAYQQALDQSPKYEGLCNVMQTALHSLIADPKPDEPVSVGTVVEDREHYVWVRSLPGYAKYPWVRGTVEGTESTTWDDLAHPVKVLSEGVTA